MSDYERLGVAFGLSAPATALALYVVVGDRLGLVAVGSLGGYGIGGDSVAVGVGFAAEALGFLVVAVGAILLGRALRIDGSVVLKASIAIGVGVPVGMVAGLLLVGHTPSGPAAPLGAVVIGLVGLPVVADGL